MPPGSWRGDCDVRLLPDDDFSPGPSTATTAPEAGGHGWSLRYTWTHPDDGEQHGTLLVGSATEDGTVSAGWIDSWHQAPELRLLTGSVREGMLTLTMDYSGWGWVIQLIGSGSRFGMLMSNVVPEEVPGATAGAYVVMQARWTPA